MGKWELNKPFPPLVFGHGASLQQSNLNKGTDQPKQHTLKCLKDQYL